MKKIINNRKYDTETATEVGSWDNGLYGNDFNAMSETLYRKRTGEYFLFGEGGAMSRYAEQVGDMWGSGWAITPMTYEAACKWAESHLSVEEYEAAFGEVSEDAENVVVSARVSAAAKKALERFANDNGMTQTQALNEILLNL